MNLICGINPVLEALAAGTRHFDRLLVVKGLRNRRIAEAIRRATQLGVPLRFEMRETLDHLAAGVPHQGIIAVVSARPLLTLEALLDSAHQPALLVVLDGVEDPRNLGAILRTAEAAGADGVLLPERHSAGLSETVARASAGALEHVRIARVSNLVQALEALKAHGIWVVGFDAEGRERWDGVDLGRPVALVLGGEGRGIRRLVREHCDHLVSIPHFGQVSSLNVSVAAGIALYEAVRQRRAVPSTVRPIPARPLSVPHIVGPGEGDEETDPGAFEHAAATDDNEQGDAAETDPTTLPPVEIHDDVAWGRGPTVLKPVGFPRAHRLRGRGRRRGPGAPRPQGGPPAPPGAHVPGGEPPGLRRGRRRRRDRSGPAEPGPDGGVPRGGAVGTSGETGSGPPPEVSGGPGERRRRRRRRRRR